jgi:CheY-like chemotaxis protein
MCDVCSNDLQGSPLVMPLAPCTSMNTDMMAKAVWGTSSRGNPGRRVLIVEDNPEASQMLATACRMEGYEAYVAGDGREAVRQLSAGVAPDVILLDLSMPVMDGWQFRRVQQQHPEWAAIPVVVVSAVIDPGRTAEMAPLAELRKPIDFNALFEVLRSIPAQ